MDEKHLDRRGLQSFRQIDLPKNLINLQSSFEELGNLGEEDFSSNTVLTRDLAEAIVKERIGQERFWNMLVSTVNKTHYSPPQDRNTVILDLACSVCEEKETVSLFFGGEDFSLAGASRSVDVIGVDNDEEAISLANGGVRKEYKDNYKFIVADAAHLHEDPRAQNVPKNADVVIIRHQQMFKPDYNDVDNTVRDLLWKQVIDQGLWRLTEQGIMLITSYTEEEHQQLLEYLHLIRANVVVNEENEFSEPLGNGGIDKYVIAIEKVKH